MIINILLKDRSTGGNIIWATETYVEEGISPHEPIQLSHVEDREASLIQPRATKSKEVKKGRTKSKAEVFTPIWVIEKMNNQIEEEFKGLNLEEYVTKTWLEITCGEGPYMCTGYDTITAEPIPIEDRVGFVDRKLQRISKEVDNAAEWKRLAILAYQSSYGYEFQGDSLLLARENMLYTFIDYYQTKFNTLPTEDDVREIAHIISYNVFQMDGLKYIVPLSDEKGQPIDVIMKDWDTMEDVPFKSLIG